MLTLEFASVGYVESEDERNGQFQESYPDEVLESEWNPVLQELRSLQSPAWHRKKTPPQGVGEALARLNGG